MRKWQLLNKGAEERRLFSHIPWREAQDTSDCACVLEFGFRGITVPQFHKCPLLPATAHFLWAIVHPLSKTALAPCKLWFSFETSVINTLSFRHRLLSSSKQKTKKPKMYFIFFFSKWFITSTPPAYRCLNFSFSWSYKASTASSHWVRGYKEALNCTTAAVSTLLTCLPVQASLMLLFALGH